MSEGKSQRFTETAYKDTKYLENIERIINEEVKKIPDAEIYTNVFSKIEKEDIEYIFVLKDKKIPTILEEFMVLLLSILET